MSASSITPVYRPTGEHHLFRSQEIESSPTTTKNKTYLQNVTNFIDASIFSSLQHTDYECFFIETVVVCTHALNSAAAVAAAASCWAVAAATYQTFEKHQTGH
jgi:hypothetical protein